MQDTTLALAASIFIRAASYIRTYGWQVEGMGTHGSPRCSMGALASAYPMEKWDNNLSQTMYDSLYEELGSINLTTFNHTYKDGEKVAQLYEHVAKKLINTSPTSLDFLSNDLAIHRMTATI